MDFQSCSKFKTPQQYKDKKILIIGAGIAGLSCAYFLKRYGFQNITILEAKASAGGRIKTSFTDDHFIELGAQWIHGSKNNPLYAFTKPLGLLEENAPNYSDALYNFNDQEIISNFLSYLSQGDDKMSLDLSTHDSLLKVYEKERNEYFLQNPEFQANPDIKNLINSAYEWFCKLSLELNGCNNLDVISKNLTTLYVQCDGSQTIELKQGFSSLITYLLENIPSSWLELSQSVKLIDWSNFVSPSQPSEKNRVYVICDNGNCYTAEHVIVTVPLGYLRRIFHRFFNPPLNDDKVKAITTIGFGTVNKIYFEFEAPFWSESEVIHVFLDEKCEEAFSKNNLVSNLWIKGINRFAYTPSHPRMLCAWVVGEGAIQMESLNDDVVIDDCIKLLSIILKKKIPLPKNIIRSSWSNDKYTYGSYSYLSMTCEKFRTTPLELAEPNIISSSFQCSRHPLIQFAGEATHPMFFSTVHGAFDSGIREASRLYHHYMQPLKDKLKIIIIGAGIAGLSSAYYLFKGGYSDITILDGNDYIGGRVKTIMHDNYPLELGPQWIHGNSTLLYDFCEKHNLLDESHSHMTEAQGSFYLSTGQKIDDKLIAEFLSYLQILKTDLEKGSIEYSGKSVLEYFEDGFKYYLKNNLDKDSSDPPTYILDHDILQSLFDWFLKFETIDNSCIDLANIATNSYKEWKDGYEGIYYKYLKRGFSSIIDMLSLHLPKRIIKLKTAVHSIKYEEIPYKILQKSSHSFHPILLNIENNSVLQADCVIVTSSAGFMQKKPNFIRDDFLRPYKKDAFDSIEFGTVNKFFLVFEDAFWNNDEFGFQLLWTKNKTSELEKLLIKYPWVKDISGFDRVEHQPNVLLGWIGGKGSPDIEIIEEKLLGEICVKLLKNFLNKDIPFPKKVYKSNWNQQKYIHGSYSSRKKSFYIPTNKWKELIEPISFEIQASPEKNLKLPLICFAGEATDKNGFGSAHGAFESGHREAHRIMHICSEVHKAIASCHSL